MKVRYFIERASLGPDELKIAFQAFASSWSQIAAHYTKPETVASARTQLATHIQHPPRVPFNLPMRCTSLSVLNSSSFTLKSKQVGWPRRRRFVAFPQLIGGLPRTYIEVETLCARVSGRELDLHHVATIARIEHPVAAIDHALIIETQIPTEFE
jgi:hypothetical protein